MKIIHLITGLGVGGAEKVLYNLVMGQLAEGHEVEVVSIGDRIEMMPVFKKSGILVQVIGMQNSPFSFFRKINKVLLLFKKLDASLIHAHMAHACLLATLIKYYLPDVKLIFTSHNVIIGNKIITALIRLSRKSRDADIVFSMNQCRNFNNLKNICVIPNGVKIPDCFTNLPTYQSDLPFKFIVVGRLEPVKNHLKLIHIAAEIINAYNFTIDIYGAGFLRSKLQEEIIDLNLQQVITLKGLSMNITTELSNYHCFLMPSLWEGMPISVLEAGAISLPIVATSVGSLPDLLNKSNSYICDLADFKFKMIEVMENYKEARKKGEILREIITQEYSMEQVVMKHLKLYQTLIDHESKT